ncbi:hypothetical protein IPF86_00640 [Candidatus Nomurabacteria bacterium]|nr:MAG: hypothetical protein IPF86_00640 [Candidatus Nomurabacteria bacterium]
MEEYTLSIHDVREFAAGGLRKTIPQLVGSITETLDKIRLYTEKKDINLKDLFKGIEKADRNCGKIIAFVTYAENEKLYGITNARKVEIHTLLTTVCDLYTQFLKYIQIKTETNKEILDVMLPQTSQNIATVRIMLDI